MLIRDDLTPGLQLAQVAHATTEFALRCPSQASSTPIVVVLGVPDKETLLGYADLLSGWDGRPNPEAIRPFVLFHDPDIGAGEHTALATVSEGAEFSSLSLAGAAMR